MRPLCQPAPPYVWDPPRALPGVGVVARRRDRVCFGLGGQISSGTAAFEIGYGRMGSWSTGVFGNDLASDVRGEYRELLEDGTPDAEALQRVLRSFAHAVDDPDNGTCFWTGLAAAQMELGRLDPAVRDRTVALIDAGGDLHMWDETGFANKRRSVLARLRGQLLGPQKAAVKVRPPGRVPCPVQAGDVFLLTLQNGRQARLRTLAVKSYRLGDIPTVQMIDDRGRPYRLFHLTDDPRMTDWTRKLLAQWDVFDGRMNEVPTAEDIQVIARETPPKVAPEVTTSLGWRVLRMECARLLDEPNARPE